MKCSILESKISVIITTYNRSSLLIRAIDSVLNQTFKEFELIIVDDGSTDNTTQIVESYLYSYDNIRFVKHKNRKQALSLNTGIQIAQGNFITFLDSDDEYLPTHLESRFNYMQSFPETDILHGGMEIIGNPYVPDKFDTSQQIHIDDCVAGGTIFGKKDIFFELDGFLEIPYSSDSNFIDRALSQNFVVKKIYEKTYRYYRDSPDSICNNLV
ncbi:MAG: glycosyltransferase family 2 protein [Bacteroidetes bacterium]|nr:MAG: glycosyltransferase family 2 protein [Bacteroidota bacterium]